MQADMSERTMPRKATSFAEFEQIARVCALLRDLRLFPTPSLRVTTVSQRTYIGHLVHDQWGNNACKGGHWTYYGTIILQTESGQVEIDYLDIAWIEPEQPDEHNRAPGKRTALRRRRRSTVGQSRSTLSSAAVKEPQINCRDYGRIGDIRRKRRSSAI
jgi:hypothetical protein